MAEKLHHIEIRAPGFLGLNTQDSPTATSPSFASIANNCVIDKFGRVGARQGWLYTTTSGGDALAGSTGTEVIHEFTSRAGVTTVLSAGNNLIFTGTATLVDDTPATATITANNWKMVTFNDDVYMFQSGHTPLMWDSSATDTILVSAHPAYSGTVPQGNEALSAYGRLWVAGVVNDCCTIYWSDMLQGFAWTGGTSGSIDLTKFWPSGDDSIVALAAHNDRLIVFGSRSILVYAGANSPSTMQLEDTIDNIGCIARDSVVNIGTDIVFLSATGYRSLARTIQEKSAPFRDLSKNVRDDLLVDYDAEVSNIKAVYSPENAFILLTFPTSNKLYCFDMRRPLEDGSHRVTTWTGIKPTALHRGSAGALYLGEPIGIATYTGYSDNSVGYTLQYYTTALDFAGESDGGDEVTQLLKFLKKVGITVVGALSPVVQLKWAYDYSSSYKSESVTLTSSNYGEYGVAEYNEGYEYSSSIIINAPRVNTTGSGTSVTVGVETQVTQAEFSIQKLNIYATIGRLS